MEKNVNEPAPAGAQDGWTTPRSTVWRRFRKSRAAIAGLVFISILMAAAYLAPVISNNKPLAIEYEGRWFFPAPGDLFPFNHLHAPDAIALKLKGDPCWLSREATAKPAEVGFLLMPPVSFSPYQTDLDALHQPPSWNSRHLLGCDDEGRDVFARILYGAKVSLLVGFLSVGVASVIGLILGAAAGFLGGWVDFLIVSRLIEVMMCFPTFFFILTVVAVMDAKYLNVWTIMLVIGLTSWPATARYARAEFMRLREVEFVAAARSIGASPLRVAARHILPNALTPVLVNAVFGIAGAILLEAALSFLGVGVQPPDPSWGNILSQVTRYWQDWWMGVFPGAAIFLTVLSYNLVGDAIRDALDPASTARA